MIQNIGQIQDENKKLKLENEILKTGVHSELKSSLFTSTLNDMILKGSSLSDSGKVTYLDAEGKPLSSEDGKPYTLQSRIDEIKLDKTNSSLIFRDGALEHIEAPQGVQDEHKGLSRSNLSFEQKNEIIKAHGREYYDGLPLVAGEA